ncbi:MAG TPA: toxic anion resistance protein [Caulobacteraceae bacterium]|nr:toxic anion resistance protein [Caulobacteraceae bacterium]
MTVQGIAAMPAADASRVAAVKNSLNLRDGADIDSFGERAKREVSASVERLLAEVRTRDLIEAREILRHVVEAAEPLDPAPLQAKGLFSGAKGKAERLRTRFVAADATLEGLSEDLNERIARLQRKADSLNALHEQSKTFILELDAYLEAGRARLAEARAAPVQELVDAAGETTEGEPAPVKSADRLEARLRQLDIARTAAVRQLPLVRVVQNVDAPLADRLGAAVKAIAAWRKDWSELLGLTAGRKGKRIRPDAVALADTKAKLLSALAAPEAAIAEGLARRSQTEEQMERLVETVRKPK